MKQQGNFKLITTKTTFSIIVAFLTIIFIWILGLGTNRSMFINSILSTSIISIAFFLFITIGPFKGFKLKDNIGEITDKIKNNSLLYQQTDNSELNSSYLAVDTASILPDFDDGDGAGIFISILLWIGYSIIITFIFWIFGTILWTGIIIFIAMLYWIFFRALRLIFKNSNRYKGNLISSVIHGISYTILYNCWIYGIIITTHYL